MMRKLQKLGSALMLPVACLPICGILMGVGYALAPAVMGAAGATEGFAYVLGEGLADTRSEGQSQDGARTRRTEDCHSDNGNKGGGADE